MARSDLSKVVALVFMSMLLLNFPVFLLANGRKFTHGVAITCTDVDNDLLPCLGYITGGGSVPSGCCDGVKTLVSSAKTKTDRQTACSCLKSLASGASDAELGRAAQIPILCGVNIHFNISRNMDCSKVNLA